MMRLMKKLLAVLAAAALACCLAACARAQARTIQVSANDATVVFELNDSAAASALIDQLPLTVEVEDFGTNEKIC